jgi:lysophospholipid acyltransferase (LPLAT)-like uncharacterized protein
MYEERLKKKGEESAAKTQHIAGWRYMLFWPLSVILRLWGATLRFKITPENRRLISKSDIPTVVIIWHNWLFVASEIIRRYRYHRLMYGLISASSDGAWLAAFLSFAGLKAIRGSSSYRAVMATRELVNQIKAGNDIAITPDGPRGPCYRFKPGAALIARQAKSPVLLITGKFHNAWRMKSWDRFHLPKPFSIVEFHCRYYDNVPKKMTNDEAAEFLGNSLKEITIDSIE